MLHQRIYAIYDNFLNKKLIDADFPFYCHVNFMEVAIATQFNAVFLMARASSLQEGIAEWLANIKVFRLFYSTLI